MEVVEANLYFLIFGERNVFLVIISDPNIFGGGSISKSVRNILMFNYAKFDTCNPKVNIFSHIRLTSLTAPAKENSKR